MAVLYDFYDNHCYSLRLGKVIVKILKSRLMVHYQMQESKDTAVKVPALKRRSTIICIEYVAQHDEPPLANAMKTRRSA